MIQRGSLMFSLFLAWHIVWFTRVTLSLILLLVIIRRQLYKPFPLFTLHTAWIALAGMGLVAMNYAPLVTGNQFFVGVAVSNSVEAILAFAIIYQIFTQRLRHYPVVSDLGRSAFRITTLIFVVIAVGLGLVRAGTGAQPLDLRLPHYAAYRAYPAVRPIGVPVSLLWLFPVVLAKSSLRDCLGVWHSHQHQPGNQRHSFPDCVGEGGKSERAFPANG